MRVVVIGAGDVGTYLTRVLSRGRSEVILVDRSAEALSRAEEEVDALALKGDATFRDVLDQAQIERADLVVAVTGNDDTNLVAAALAASSGARRTVARVDAPGFYRSGTGIEQSVLGIHSVLCASRLVSAELLRLVRTLDADYVGNFAGHAAQVCMLTLGDAAPVLGKAASALKLDSRVTVCGVVREGLPRAAETVSHLEAGDGVIVAGPPRAVTRALAKIRGRGSDRRVVIIGGGDVGYHLAETLTQTERLVQVIEQDRERCTFLAERLARTNVVHGDGTSMSCLRDEQIESADCILAVTRADEVNLMATLMASHLGVARTFALVHRPGYSDVYEQFGIRGTTGPHDVIARSVDWLIPHPGALASEPLGRTGYHLVEVVVPAQLRRALLASELPLPQGVLLAAVVRRLECIAAAPSLELCGGDHLLLVAPAGSVPRVERRVRRLGKDARE